MNFSLSQALSRGIKVLQKFENPRLECELLLEALTGLSREKQILDPSHLLSSNQIEKFNHLLNRRLDGEPSAYITGKKHFYEDVFFIKPGVLIPRPDTELLVEEGLKFAPRENPLRILDMGAGSGCVGLSLAKLFPRSQVVLSDISPVALDVIKMNSQKLGVAERVQVLSLDLDQTFSLNELKKLGPFDLIVSNPPYISLNDARVERDVNKFEPHLALYSGPTGLEKISSWGRAAAQCLSSHGLCIFEFGQGQGPEVLKLFLSFFKNAKLAKDLSGDERAVIGSLPI